jgi:phosphate transport system substrate-binding protein
MNRSALFTSALIVSILLSGVSQAADTIRINGSGSALDMMKPLAEAYRKMDPNVTIMLEKPLGSSGAIKALLAGALDVAVSSKPLKPEETAKGARLKEYGRTPLAIVTEKNVPRSDITTQELVDIYSGRMTRWKNGEIIRLVLRPEGDIDTHILRGLSPGMNKAMDESKSRPGMIVAVTDPEAYSVIAKTPGSIGASGLTSIIVENLPLKVLTLNNVSPTTKALVSGGYPLAKEISFIIAPGTSPAALKFISFAYSSQGRAIAERAGVLIVSGSAPTR